MKDFENKIQDLKQIFNNLPEIIILLDKDYHIYYLNNFAEETLRFKNKELNSKLYGFSDYIYKDDLNIFNQSFSNIKQNKKNIIRIRSHKNIEYFYIEFSVSIFNFNEDFIYIIFAKNINKSIELEKKIFDISHFITIGKLLRFIVHEFNNILGIITGRIELALSVKNQEEKDKTFVLISEVSKRLRLIFEILALFAIGNNNKFKLVSINNEIQNILILLTKFLEKFQIKLNIEYGEIPNTCFNLIKIKQCIIELIINSAESMKDGGIIHIKTWYEISQNMIFLSIKDNGSGIKETDLDKIFELNFSTKEKRLGLGLFLVKESIFFHKGKIEVKSKVNKGSEFILSFPLVKEELYFLNNNKSIDIKSVLDNDTVSDEVFLEWVKDKDIIILFVDDEIQMKEIFKFIFMNKGIRLFYAENAKEALLLCSKVKFDFIFSDVYMSDISGKDLYLKVKNIYKEDVNFIFNSGFPIKDDLKEIIKQDKIYFIAKPFNQKDIWELSKKIIYNKIK